MPMIRATIAAAACFAGPFCLADVHGAVPVDHVPGFEDSQDQLSLLQVSSRKRGAHGSSDLALSFARMPVVVETFAEFDPEALDAEPPMTTQQQPVSFRFGYDIFTQDHPQAISKPMSRANSHGVSTMQYYEAVLPDMTAMVLNIKGNRSNGEGGLTLALEVHSPCGEGQDDLWTAVDHTRCSAKYPCALRLPAHAGRVEGALTRFRTRVVEDDEGYGTDVLRYQRISLDYESVVLVATSEPNPESRRQRRFQFTMSKAMASGSLEVIPQVVGASDNTRITMKIRQKDVTEPKFPWARVWRSPSADLEGCSYRNFEVVAEDLFEGLVEMEVFLTGDEHAELGTVMVTSRLGLAEAESNLLEMVLKSHSNFFLDPANMIHGLPMTSINPYDVGDYAWSNPTEWGFALTALATMGELQWISVSEAVKHITVGLKTMDDWQNTPSQFSRGLFFPYYKLRVSKKGQADYGMIYKHPHRSDYLELPCGDNALLYSSLVLLRGWLLTVKFHGEATLAEQITSKLDFSKCMHHKSCPNDAEDNVPNDVRPWAVAMTVNSETEKLFPFDWNVWADEGGVVGFTAMLSNSMSDDQFHSMVAAQQTYSPCETWQNITVANTAYFNSVFTLPTRSFIGFGSLFSSPTYHEFYIRSVVPTFRAHRATKAMIGDDYFGPSDAMSQGIGSKAFFPPNTQYKPCAPNFNTSNKCTWCDEKQYFDSGEDHHLTIPHGSAAAFLAVAAMETSQVEGWIDDLKSLMSDVSGVYNESYGFEVIGPNRRTPLVERANFAQTASDSKSHGAGYYEALSHSYTFLSIYEGMAATRRRFELLKNEGAELRGPEPSHHYRPLSDFLDAVPKQRNRIDKLLAKVKTHENRKICQPSSYGPSPNHDL